MAPTTKGDVRTLKVQLWPTASIVPSIQVPGFTLKLPLSPNASNEVSVNASLPVLVSVTVSSLVDPTGTCPTATTLGDKVSADVPANAVGTATTSTATNAATTAVTARRIMIPP
jgi:hypothetical protein